MLRPRRLIGVLTAFGVFLGLASPALDAAPLVAKPPADKARFHLFLLAGQSNMAGRGSISDLTPAETRGDSRVLALTAANTWEAANDPIHWDKPGASGVGLGKFFAKAVVAKSPGVTVGLVPAACGGSSISVWEPGKYFKDTDSHPYDDALARARFALQTGTLRAILWHQGESDANAQASPHYEKRLEALIARFRTDLKSPELPFIIGQLGQFPKKPWTPAQQEIDRAQRAVAARVKNVRFVSSEGLVDTRDNLHFATASLRTFGERYAEAYLQLAPKK